MTSMKNTAKIPAEQAFVDSKASDRSHGVLFRFWNRHRSPVELARREYRARRRAEWWQRSPLRPILNVVKTVLVLLLWTAFTPYLMIAVSPYVAYGYAQTTLFGLVLSSAILLHVWPTRTPQWRTLFWLFWLVAGVGSILLQLGAGTSALTSAVLVGFLFVLLRINQNGRKLLQQVRDWRAMR